MGIGYVGLPLARRACAVGLRVVGFDVAGPVVAGLSEGRSHIQDVSDNEVARMRAAGFVASADPSVLARAETVAICVPTGLTVQGEPDLSAVTSAAETLAAHLRPGTLVVLESTTYPGTTEELVRPLLEMSGLVTGTDFYLGYSPERIDPGNREFTVETTPKIVSGVTSLCAKRCVAFYERLVESVVVARGTREAELAKLLENAYRHVNIALVNELAVLSHRLGIDIWDVIRCAGTKPYGFQAFRPGPGVGGHCIPVDPRYLSFTADAAGLPCTVIDAATRVNAAMPAHVVGRVRDTLHRNDIATVGAHVLLLGVTYKRDVADVRESPAVGVVRGLRTLGATVSYHDPYAPEFTVDGAAVRRADDLDSAVRASAVTVLLQDHGCYDLDRLTRTATALLDTRGLAVGDRVERL